ncbi:tumor suppressor candidate 2-like [Glandiceps talaboti]
MFCRYLRYSVLETMGNSTARGVRKLVSPVTKVFYGNTQENDDSSVDGTSSDSLVRQFKTTASPFVLTRTSSMYFDEDGDLAHEFYEEMPVPASSKQKSYMKKIYRNLRPQGTIEYEVPRLHPNIPTVIYQIT